MAEVMNDMISRKDAINTALEFFVEFLGGAFHEDDQKILMKRMNDLPSAKPDVPDRNVGDMISRQEAIEDIKECAEAAHSNHEWDMEQGYINAIECLEELPSAQPERLTDDDFETIRIHLNAYKEKLCNHRMWKEAEEYQRIIDRFMAFASAQPRKGEWIKDRDGIYHCSCCNTDYLMYEWNVKDTHYCPNCGADMRKREDNNV